MAQTSVEWLIEKLYNASAGSTSLTYKEIIVQAKEMHKAEIKIAYSEGNLSAYGKNYDKTGEQYYNENFKTQ